MFLGGHSKVPLSSQELPRLCPAVSLGMKGRGKSSLSCSPSCGSCSCSIDSWLWLSCEFVFRFRAKSYPSPCLDRMTTIEILSWLVTLTGNPRGFVFMPSLSSVWSLQGICSPGPCGAASPRTPSPANPALPGQCQCLTRWVWPCGYRALGSNVTGQIYSGSKPTQTPAHARFSASHPCSVAGRFEQLFLVLCLKLHPGSGDKLNYIS